jgi:EAL domain-containing protein (putative c-di-GMP-specific phosphodiesterase class I)
LIAVDCVDLVNELTLVRRIAEQLAMRNIGISIDGINAQGASLAGRRELPVVEMKVDRQYIRGCADDRIKQPTARKSWPSRAIRVRDPWPKV